jgi:hypothetical protein
MAIIESKIVEEHAALVEELMPLLFLAVVGLDTRQGTLCPFACQGDTLTFVHFEARAVESTALVLGSHHWRHHRQTPYGCPIPTG